MLTLVTAAHANPDGLRSLHAALQPGLGNGLQWVIQDSGACVASRRWGETLGDPAVRFASEPDGGIYDALNRALLRVDTDYYLVIGSDDAVDVVALRAIVGMLQEWDGPRPDVLTFPVRVGDGLRRPRRWWPGQVNVLGLTASHSVGTVIRRALHDRYGAYDTRYRILADALFLRRSQLGGARFAHRDGPVPGRFSLGGVSTRDHGRLMCESFAYNVECGSSRALQSLVFLVRLCAYRPRSFR